ncbi:MAG: zinc ribbon domain-containing protein [Xenococcaceae cyanobacterium MO_167.B52]|nr:zinc ribbon domain-containing protein [Xenococcaceae cyanobacterium MO_167.B52]
MFGKIVIAVPPQYTSQECSSCHPIVKKSWSERTHACECGCILDRDENASRNLWAKGLEYLSRGGHSRIKDTALGGFPDLKQVSGTPKDI